LTAAEAGDFASCCKALSAVAQHLNTALSQQPDAAARHQVLAAVLQQQTAFSAGTLLSWVLQRLQQLQLIGMEERLADIHTPKALLLASCALLLDLSRALPHRDGSNTARIMLEQMERSGMNHILILYAVAFQEQAA
jgi:translation initiation factor 2B subunit (eIF-2B alpha/beta/delta family)